MVLVIGVRKRNTKVLHYRVEDKLVKCTGIGMWENY